MFRCRKSLRLPADAWFIQRPAPGVRVMDGTSYASAWAVGVNAACSNHSKQTWRDECSTANSAVLLLEARVIEVLPWLSDSRRVLGPLIPCCRVAMTRKANQNHDEETRRTSALIWPTSASNGVRGAVIIIKRKRFVSDDRVVVGIGHNRLVCSHERLAGCLPRESRHRTQTLCS